MKKTAIFPYTSDGYGQPLVGLAPGLPQSIEAPYTQGTRPASELTSEKGMPGWMLPVGLAAAGIGGWRLLKALAKKNKNVAQAAERAIQQGEAAGLGGAVKAPPKPTKGSISSPAPTQTPAVGAPITNPLEIDAIADPKLMSQLYPGSPVGARAGEYAEEYFKRNPGARRKILSELEKAKKAT